LPRTKTAGAEEVVKTIFGKWRRSVICNKCEKKLSLFV
jgi:hypothetical protein